MTFLLPLFLFKTFTVAVLFALFYMKHAGSWSKQSSAPVYGATSSDRTNIVRNLAKSPPVESGSLAPGSP